MSWSSIVCKERQTTEAKLTRDRLRVAHIFLVSKCWQRLGLFLDGEGGDVLEKWAVSLHDPYAGPFNHRHDKSRWMNPHGSL